MVHLGVGNFFRAHQAWYTEHASDAADWGVAAFTGRSGGTAEALNAQDCLYTLLLRHESRAVPEVIGAISAAHAGSDLKSLRQYLASPAVAVVTLTVTEAGYCRDQDGGLDVRSPRVHGDITALCGDAPPDRLATVPGRLVAGLDGRRVTGAGPLAVVSCDNLPDNGDTTRRVVTDLARRVDRSLAEWIADEVSFVTTVVDRITPGTADEDRAEALALTGVDDPALVVTEPVSEWVLCGGFPAGRPAWETSGARFVEDARPFEARKLWLLNGAHSLIAYAGSILGHETVADAVADPQVRSWVQEWWDCASRHIPLPGEDLAAYRGALLDRFANPAVRHRLDQIAIDGSLKIPLRAIPVVRAERGEERLPTGAARLLAGWIAHLRGLGAPVHDVEAARLIRLARGSARAGTVAVLDWLGVDDSDVVELVARELELLERLGHRS